MAVCNRHPELIKGQRDLWHDQERIAKPIVDSYELEEFDSRISYAMEYNLAVIITIWSDGFTSDITGRVHYVDPITHQLRIEADDGFHRINFDDVVGVVVVISSIYFLIKKRTKKAPILTLLGI